MGVSKGVGLVRWYKGEMGDGRTPAPVLAIAEEEEKRPVR